MIGYCRAGITRALVWTVLLAGSVGTSDANAPEPALTIARVAAWIAQAKRRSTSYKRTGQLLPGDWGKAMPRWQPETTLGNRPRLPNPLGPVSPLIQQLVANAICRQHQASLRAAHALDGDLGGWLFWYDEALIANEIARRRGLAIHFRPPFASLSNQSLREINRTRRLQQVLSEAGPERAIELVRSFRQLCRDASVR